MLGKISTQPHAIIVKKKLFSQKQSIVFAIFFLYPRTVCIVELCRNFSGCSNEDCVHTRKKNEINTAHTSLPSHQR